MTDQPNTPTGVTAGAGSATCAAPQLPGAISHGPPGVFLGQHYTPWGALPIAQPQPSQIEEAQREFDKVYHAYNRAVTLQQTQKSHEIYPALREARRRLMAAQIAGSKA